MEPEKFDLPDFEEKYYKKLLKAYHGCFQELRKTEAIKWIQANVEDCQTYSKAFLLYEDMNNLFSRFLDKNNALKRAALVEKMYQDAEMMRSMAAKLSSDGQYYEAGALLEKANNLREKAAKLEGLDKVPDNFNPREITLPEIIISSDPKILLPSPEDVYEDAEEITE